MTTDSLPATSSTTPRYGLAIHTASADLGLAIGRAEASPNGAAFRCQTWGLGREVSNYLHAYLQQFIQPQTWSDLAFIAVAKGPGGFTGTRLGVVTARTLAQQLDLPLYAISTLAAVAWADSQADSQANSQTGVAQAQSESQSESDIAVQMLAQRGEIHGAIYRGADRSADGLKALSPDAVMSLKQWQQLLDNWQQPYRLVQVEGNLGATAASVLQLAQLDWQMGLRPHWSEALPFYGQSPV